MSEIKQKENMDEFNVKRHQIAAKTYRGVELLPIENIYYFWRIKICHGTPQNGSVLIDETFKRLRA